MPSGKCKLKPQWAITTQVLEWPKSRTLATLKAGEDGRQELSFVTGDNANWYSPLARQFDSFL